MNTNNLIAKIKEAKNNINKVKNKIEYNKNKVKKIQMKLYLYHYEEIIKEYINELKKQNEILKKIINTIINNKII